MLNIKPISDLRHYSNVLRDVSYGSPPCLTKNGHGRYVIIGIQEYEMTNATLALMNELGKGKKAGDEKGWLSPDGIRKHFKAKTNEK